MHYNLAYNRGFKSFKDNVSISANPYSYRTSANDYSMWKEGWLSAQRLSLKSL